MRKIMKSLSAIMIAVTIFMLGWLVGERGNLLELAQKTAGGYSVFEELRNLMADVWGFAAERFALSLERINDAESIVQLVSDKINQLIKFMIEAIEKILVF